MISNFVVPIYNERDFVGTGFILGNYLLTAAHVVKDLSHPIFIFENRKYHLRKCDVRFFMYDKYSADRNDLAIYEVCINSQLRLSTSFNNNDTCCYVGFSYSEENKQVLENTYSGIRIIHEYAYSTTNDHSKRRRYNNCWTCSPSCVEGNSGGPLFQGEEIIGLYIASLRLPPSFIALEDYYIKGDYIKSIIDMIVSIDKD